MSLINEKNNKWNMLTILFLVIFICDAVLALIKSIVLFYSLRIFFLSLDQFYFLPFRLVLIAYRSVINCEDEWHYLVKVEIIRGGIRSITQGSVWTVKSGPSCDGIHVNSREFW